MRLPTIACAAAIGLLLPAAAQDLRHGLVAADAVVVGRQVAKTPHDEDVTLHVVQVVLDVRGARGASAVTVLDWPKLALHQRPTPRQSRLYCLQDASANAARLGLPADKGPYFKMVGFAGSNPLVGADLAADPVVRFARLLAAGEAGAGPNETARGLFAIAVEGDPAVRAEAARLLIERPDLRQKLDGLHWSRLIGRAVGETDDIAYKSALAEQCAEQRRDGVFDALRVGYAAVVGRIGKGLHGEDAATKLLARLQQTAQAERRAPLLLALGATNTAGALDALMRMDRKDPAVVAALKAHRDPKAQEAVAPKPAK